jgi:hypothetical protein
MAKQLIPQQEKLSLEQIVETQGFQYHVRLAPGVPFGVETTNAVREAVLKNRARIESTGGEFDLSIAELF